MRFKVLIASITIFLLSCTVTQAQVVINEISPSSNPEWVELYNNSDQEINLEGWEVADDETTTGHFNVTITQAIQNTVISAHGFLVVKGGSGGLSNSSDQVFLYTNNSETPVDSYLYENGKTGKSFSRIPDATGSFVLTEYTEGTYNQAPTSTPVPTSSPTPSPDPTSTPRPTSTPKPSPTNNPTATISPSNITTPPNKIIETPETVTSTPTPETDSNTIVLGDSSDAPTPTIEEKSKNSGQNKLATLLSISGLAIVLLSLGFAGIKYYKTNVKMGR